MKEPSVQRRREPLEWLNLRTRVLRRMRSEWWSNSWRLCRRGWRGIWWPMFRCRFDDEMVGRLRCIEEFFWRRVLVKRRSGKWKVWRVEEMSEELEKRSSYCLVRLWICWRAWGITLLVAAKQWERESSPTIFGWCLGSFYGLGKAGRRFVGDCGGRLCTKSAIGNMIKVKQRAALERFHRLRNKG